MARADSPRIVGIQQLDVVGRVGVGLYDKRMEDENVTVEETECNIQQVEVVLGLGVGVGVGVGHPHHEAERL